MSHATAEKIPFLEPLTERARELAGAGPAWLRRLRRDNLARFEALGFPDPQLEEWKNTNVAPIAGEAFRPATRVAAPAEAAFPEAARLELGRGPRIVLVNGYYDAARSEIQGLPEGAWVGGLARAVEEIPERIEPYLIRRKVAKLPAFCALNGAFLEDGAVVLIPDDTQIDNPIRIVHAACPGNDPLLLSPRTLIVVGAGSRVEVVETHVGATPGVYLTNAVNDAFVADNARLDHYRLQLEGPEAFHVATWTHRQGRDSHYAAHNLNLGGRLVRHDIGALINGEGAECRLYGLILTRDRQHVDNHSVIDHAKPHGDSREVYKGILDGHSRTVFNGRIIVRRGAQKTDAKQSNPNLLLSRHALAHTRPQLEIYADDVKCTHGATVGRLDEDAIFYLRSRGVPSDAARHLLIQAFAGEQVEAIELAQVRAWLEGAVAEWLEGSRP